jgi:predicted nucleic acid-binding protein
MGCTLLLTEDLQHDQQIDNLRIVNPFQADIGLLDATP